MIHCSQTRQEGTELMTPLRPRATQKKAPPGVVIAEETDSLGNVECEDTWGN